LVYTETYNTIHEARIRERQLHKWSHAKKQALIDGDINRLKSLSKSTRPELAEGKGVQSTLSLPKGEVFNPNRADTYFDPVEK